MKYIEVIITVADQTTSDMLVAALSGLQYYGFQEEDGVLKAYINAPDYDTALLNQLLGSYGITPVINEIAEQNWNALWESNFQPITVENFVGVRAHFHEPMEDVQHEIIITPKMSFGTGHHATTWLMMKEMEAVDFRNKKVFDFGTGTGILAILAEQLGAASVLAIDYDDWCIENANENLDQNGCEKITVIKGDTANVDQLFDVILANINRHIIEANLAFLAQNLAPGGVLLLSGLLLEDEKAIVKQLQAQRLQFTHTVNRTGWIAIRCGK